MKYVKLGQTGMEVSRLCFGALVIGPLQANLSVDRGAEVIVKALEAGVNFIDTAELYGTYSHIREAVKRCGKKPVIAAKSYAYDRKGASASLEKARRGLNLDYIDVFMLHEQETRLTLRGHREALEYYLEEKAKGRIGAVGVSTHRIEVVEACSEMPEIDVIHPIVNKNGLGIGDGTIDEMLSAIKTAYEKGKGIYSMKPLGGGNMSGEYDACMKFVLDIPFIHSVAVGMQSEAEVEMNAALFSGDQVTQDMRQAAGAFGRQLHIDFWCEGCGKCVERCRQKALMLDNSKAVPDSKKCVLCGYCSSVCPQFAIKMY